MPKKAPEEKLVCNHCGKKFKALPFRCKFCSLQFCGDHRLPEDHNCVGLELRKGSIRERIARGEKLTYEPKVRKEIKIKFEEPKETGFERQERDLTAPLLKSPIAIIGLIVAAIVFIGIILVLLK